MVHFCGKGKSQAEVLPAALYNLALSSKNRIPHENCFTLMIGRMTLPALPILRGSAQTIRWISIQTISGPDLIERLHPYDIILAMRERTGLRADVLSQLPNLKENHHLWYA